MEGDRVRSRLPMVHLFYFVLIFEWCRKLNFFKSRVSIQSWGDITVQVSALGWWGCFRSTLVPIRGEAERCEPCVVWEETGPKDTERTSVARGPIKRLGNFQDRENEHSYLRIWCRQADICRKTKFYEHPF